MKVHNFDLEDFMDTSYLLLGIHSNLSISRLTFIVNKNLNILLKREKQDIVLKEGNVEAFYPVLTFEENNTLLYWSLVGNKFKVKIQNNFDEGLFQNSAIKEDSFRNLFLIREWPKVNAFLKIEGEVLESYKNEILSKLNKIKEISTAYYIDVGSLKSGYNLIF